MPTTSRKETIPDHVLALLGDGIERSAQDVASELADKIGRSYDSIYTCMTTHFRTRTNVERRRKGGRWYYRRTDVGAAA